MNKSQQQSMLGLWKQFFFYFDVRCCLDGIVYLYVESFNHASHASCLSIKSQTNEIKNKIIYKNYSHHNNKTGGANEMISICALIEF